jgi:hypothetical protein
VRPGPPLPIWQFSKGSGFETWLLDECLGHFLKCGRQR